MGHLINPISMRIGCVYDWEDCYFVEPIYYPEYLHIIFKIKLYLIYFFGSSPIENDLAVFYSHFDVIKISKNLFVRIYFYHGKIESAIDEFFYENLKEIKNDRIICSLLSNRRPYQDFGHAETFMILLVFKFFSVFYWNEWPFNVTRKLIHILEEKNISNLRVLLKTSTFRFLSKNFRTSLMCFYSLFLYMWKIHDDAESFLPHHYLDLIRQFLFGLFWVNCFNIVFKNIAKWLNSFFNYIFGLKHIITKMYIIGNDDVTAKFISRYMARKYQQGYRVMDMVSPLTKELKFVIENLKDTSIMGAFKDNKSNVNYFRGLFKHFLMLMHSAFVEECYKFYNINYIWITLEFLILEIQNVKKFKNINKLIGISKNLIKNQIGFFLFFNTKYMFFKNLVFNSLLAWNNLFLRSIIDFSEFFNHMIEELYTFNFVFFWISNIYVNAKIIQKLLIYLNKFIQKVYCNFNYIYNLNFMNKQKIRTAIRTKIDNLKSEGIIGFKFQIKGRFSRRQKVSHVFFKHGLMPLNTITAHIEYAYYVIPIENSATIVKVWIYRNGYKSADWYLRIV
jgi:hypothetical protein